MNEWQLYPGNRRIRKEKSYVVIVPELFQKLENSSMPIFCDVCENCFSRPEDKKSFEKFKCCSFCADTWAYSHKDEWEMDGDRQEIK